MLALLLAVVTGQANDNITLISGYIFDGGTPSRHDSPSNYLVDAENTKWCTDKSDRVDGIWYCEFHTASPVRVDGYRIITGDDNLWYNDRNPMNWELKAKVNSYDDWMTIAKVDYDNVLEDDNFRSFDFMVDEPGVYQYFRYEVSDNQGADDMQMEELQLFYSGEAASEVETITFISDYIYDGGTSSTENTKWCTDKSDRVDGIWYCEFHTASPVRVDGYQIITGDDNLYWTNRNPLNWVLKAKVNSGDQWTDIATVTNDNKLQDENFMPYDFKVDVPGVYQYFRLEVSENHGSSDMQMEELRLFYIGEGAGGTGQANGNITLISGYTFDGGTPSMFDQSPNYLIDGITNDSFNKWCTSIYDRDNGIWYCEFHTASLVRVDGYQILTGFDTGSTNGRNPHSWVLKAKANTGDQWTAIATVTNDQTLENKSLQPYDFNVDTPGKYQYFRFEVSENCGEDCMQIQELQLFYSNESARELSTDESGAYLINSDADWTEFSQNFDTYKASVIKQTNNINVSTPVGNWENNNPFTGTFNGNGYTMNVSINDNSAYGTAPFRYIVGATICNVVATGSVTSTQNHTSGLVGMSNGANTIENCLVNVNVNCGVHCGGIVGHGLSGTLTMTGCAYTGELKTNNNVAGGLQGWADDNTVIMTNCIFAGSKSGGAKFNPIAINVKDGSGSGNCYYTVAGNNSSKYSGKQARSISAGNVMTSLAISGTATEYNVSGITAYATGIKFRDVYYAGNGDAVGLTLAHVEKAGYPFRHYEVTGGGSLDDATSSTPTLTMADANAVISAIYKTDADYADEVIALIAAIGEVAYREDCQARIGAARSAYNALTDAQKAIVTNYSVLTAAENQYVKILMASLNLEEKTEADGSKTLHQTIMAGTNEGQLVDMTDVFIVAKNRNTNVGFSFTNGGESPTAQITINRNAVNGIDCNGLVKFGAKYLTYEDTPGNVNIVFDFRLEDKNGTPLNLTNGTATVTMPYADIVPDGKNPTVWCYNRGILMEQAVNAQLNTSTKVLTFTVPSF